jgi:hypothetical protein
VKEEEQTMADDRANIDILFRNGLKDYEVLPPDGTWDTIKPAVRKQQRPVLILRYAAMVAVLVSLGFLTYNWSLSLQDTSIKALSFNPESENGSVPLQINIPPLTNVAQEMSLSGTAMHESINSRNMIQGPAEIIVSLQTANLTVMKGSKSNMNRLVLREKHVPVTYSLLLNAPGTSTSSLQPENRPARKERWSVAALVSPTYYSGFNPGNNALTNLLVSEEQPLVSYAGGLAFSYKVSGRFSLQSGLYYSSLGNQLSGISSFAGFQGYDYSKSDHNFEVLTSNGTVYTSSSDVFLIDKLSEARVKTPYTTDVFDPTKANLRYLDNALIQNFGYLEFPLMIKYKLIDKTLGFNVIGGLSSNFLVNNAVYSTLNGNKLQIGRTEGVNTVSFSSSIGMGMEYNLGKNLSLNLEPTFRYYLNPYTGTDGMRIHPFTFGVFSGLSYKF